jgi:hypothetical protein
VIVTVSGEIQVRLISKKAGDLSVTMRSYIH